MKQRPRSIAGLTFVLSLTTFRFVFVLWLSCSCLVAVLRLSRGCLVVVLFCLVFCCRVLWFSCLVLSSLCFVFVMIRLRIYMQLGHRLWSILYFNNKAWKDGCFTISINRKGCCRKILLWSKNKMETKTQRW
jgi:hypothetical protein